MRKNIINQTGSLGLSSITTINTPQSSSDREIVVWDGENANTIQGGGVRITADKIIASPNAVAFDPIGENPGDEYTAWVNNEGQLYLGEYPVGGSAGVTGPETSLQNSIATWVDADGSELAANGIIIDEDFLRGCKGVQLIPQETTPEVTGYTTWVNNEGDLMYQGKYVGDVLGPSDSVNEAVAVFSGNLGNSIKYTGLTIPSNNTITWPTETFTAIKSPTADHLLRFNTNLKSFHLGTKNISTSQTGTQNMAFGENSLRYLTSGSNNIGLGVNTLCILQSGSGNTALGGWSQYNTSTGSNNTTVGYNSCVNLKTGSSNVTIGHNAGSTYTGQ